MFSKVIECCWLLPERSKALNLMLVLVWQITEHIHIQVADSKNSYHNA